MIVRDTKAILSLFALGLIVGGCEPATITDARDQLGRGGERIVEFLIPVVSTVFKVETLLDSSRVDTTASGVLAVRFAPQTLSVGIGDTLAFIGVGDSVSIEESQKIVSSDVDFGDLEDAVRNSTINSANILFVAANSAGAPVILSDFNLGVVRLDVSGNVPRDVFGVPAYEVDSLGDPILVPVVDPGQTTFTLDSAAVSAVTLPGGELVDYLVQLLLGGDSASIVAAGTITVGDAGTRRINATDRVSVILELAVELDITIPDSGVSFTRSTVQDGLDLSPEDANQIVDRLVSATLTTEVTNRTSFGVEVDIAFTAGDLGESADVFSRPDRVALDKIVLGRPTVDTAGLVVQPSTSTVVIALTGDQARQLLDEAFTAGLRVLMLPGTGGGGRGVIRAADEVVIDSRVRIRLRAGTSQ